MTVLGLISGTSTGIDEVIVAYVADKITKGRGRPISKLMCNSDYVPDGWKLLCG